MLSYFLDALTSKGKNNWINAYQTADISVNRQSDPSSLRGSGTDVEAIDSRTRFSEFFSIEEVTEELDWAEDEDEDSG